MIEIEGSVKDIRFRSEESSFTVFQLDTEDGDITAVGNILSINVGDQLLLKGELVYHENYGQQIKVRTYKRVMPKTSVQIERYLSSGIIPFVGEATAKEIVKKFGEHALDIITDSPERLLEIRGIGKIKQEAIYQAICDEKESREIFIFLQELGIKDKMARKIYSQYEDKTIEKIQENPYRLIDDIYGIGFNIADKIARKNNIPVDSAFRIQAGILYYLNKEANSQGDSYLLESELLIGVKNLLGLHRDLISHQFFNLEITGRIKRLEIDGEKLVYLKSLYDSENNVAHRVTQLLNSPINRPDILEEDLIRIIEEKADIVYSKNQREAIIESLKNDILIITGGPGTGKTTIIKAIIEGLNHLNQSYLLAAPTGRAAKKMEESTGQKAKTIHRLLGFKAYLDSEDEDPLDYNEDNPLPADAIIIDEVSMIDIFLMESLIKAIAQDTRLILVGDIDQLPSVGPGNVLKDLISSGQIKTIKLDQIFRQGEESNIILNAHRINKGMVPFVNEEGKDFFFIKTKNDKESLDLIGDLLEFRLPNYYDYHPIKDIQVLAAMKKGICGVESLNSHLQNRLNPADFNKEEIEYKNIIFRDEDKVMQIRNNYDKEFKDFQGKKDTGIYNGDFGFIRNIYPKTSSLEVFLDDKIVEYDNKDLSDLSLAYAITIHKSQGSEFPAVVIPLVRGPYMLLNRNLIYTAITRAKELVVLVGDDRVLEQMIKNNNSKKRNSSLGYKINYYRKLYEGE